MADGVWAIETEGALRGLSKMFSRVPVGAKHFPGFERDSTYEDPATRWPDFCDDMLPRPAVVVITKRTDGIIGS